MNASASAMEEIISKTKSLGAAMSVAGLPKVLCRTKGLVGERVSG